MNENWIKTYTNNEITDEEVKEMGILPGGCRSQNLWGPIMVHTWYTHWPFPKTLKSAIPCYSWWRGKDLNLRPSGYEFYVPPYIN